MKGRYGKGHMMIYGHTLPGAAGIARSALRTGQLTERAKQKLKVMDWHRNHGQNMSLTARHFGFTRKTIRLWKKQLRLLGPSGLNEKSRAPKEKPKPTTKPDVIMQICKIRKTYPAWSKYKIREILERNYGIVVSTSTVGRVLKRKGLINKKKSEKRKKAALRPKRRFPKGFSISKAGDMVQMDTKYIMLPGGRKLYQFTAIDVLTKQRILGVYPSLSSRNGANFFKKCIREFLFTIRAIQTDNGPEFLKEFERECRNRNIPHYFIYPRQAKQNSYVERSHGSDEYEFYQLGNVWQSVEKMNEELQKWQNIWNNFRPHEALNYQTPRAYFEKLKGRNLATKNVIILQT
jgi:transposase InsO family protein